jgi:hypothetical protein
MSSPEIEGSNRFGGSQSCPHGHLHANIAAELNTSGTTITAVIRYDGYVQVIVGLAEGSE